MMGLEPVKCGEHKDGADSVSDNDDWRTRQRGPVP